MKMNNPAKFVIGLVVLLAFITLYNLISHNYTGVIEQVTNPNAQVSETPDFWDEIFLTSDRQSIISKDVLKKTLKFMMHEAEEDDPELLKFVSSLIVPPSTRPLNLAVKGVKSDYSQMGQSKYIDNLLKGKRKGFFVEAGGYDGESGSNSLFFELERDWNGILIEAMPDVFKTLVGKNRRCHAINACIVGDKPRIVKFRIFGMLSGRDSQMDTAHKKRIKSESKNEKPVIVFVPCFSLKTILKAMKVDQIDYFSLDVEGGEFDVLKNLPLNDIDITTFTIEYNGAKDKATTMTNYLKEFGYKLLHDDNQDIFLSKGI